jgi:SAM-dependent methyltransferase
MRRQIDSLLEGDLDWTLFIELCLSHRVTPLVYRALSGAVGVPEEILSALEGYFQTNARRSEQLVAELQQILAALELAGVPAVPYKGPALALTAYGEIGLRLAGDLDLLIRKEHLSATRRELEHRGYIESHEYETGHALTHDEELRLLDYQCELLYVRPHDETMVEPHWDIAPRTFAVALDHDGLWRRTKSFQLAGESVRCFSHEDLLLVLCIHAAKQEWTELRWICDVAELIQSAPSLDWPACLSRAADQGCARMLAVGLALAQSVLDTSLPEMAHEAVRNDRTARRLAETSARRLFEPKKLRPGVFRLSVYQIRLRERTYDKWTYLFRTATTPQVTLTRALPLPQIASFLYRPLKVVLSAVVLPTWNRLKQRIRAEPVKPLLADTARWSTRSFAWETWANESNGLSGALSELALEIADVSPGDRVLDLACGVGEPAIQIARAVGDGGFAIGMDSARGMLEAARRRAPAQQLALCRARMETLPFATASFDAVVCRFGIEHAREPSAVLAEARRVLAPGGSLTLLLWSPTRDDPTRASVQSAIEALFGDAAEADPALLRWGRPGLITAELARAGFEKIHEHDRVVHGSSSETAWWLPLELAFGALRCSLPEPIRAALETRISESWQEEGAACEPWLRARVASGVAPDGPA